MSDKAMPLGRKFKVRLTITPEETGTPVDMLGFTFTSGRNGRMEPETPAPHKDDFTPEFIEPLI